MQHWHSRLDCSRRHTLAVLLSFPAVALAWRAAQAQNVIKPARGSPQRIAILNALRPEIQAEIGGEIEFVVSELRVLGDWAYVSASPQRLGGKPIDWRATKFRKDWEDDVMSDLVLALLRRDGGNWTVVEREIGPTDVSWVEWIKTYKLPKLLFSDE